MKPRKMPREEREARERYRMELTRRLIDKIERLRKLNAERHAADGV